MEKHMDTNAGNNDTSGCHLSTHPGHEMQHEEMSKVGKDMAAEHDGSMSYMKTTTQSANKDANPTK